MEFEIAVNLLLSAFKLRISFCCFCFYCFIFIIIIISFIFMPAAQLGATAIAAGAGPFVVILANCANEKHKAKLRLQRNSRHLLYGR